MSMNDNMNDKSLDALLQRHFNTTTRADDLAAANVARRLASRRLPAQAGGPWLRWPAILLNWDFAPAWTRVAALGACVVVGFVSGLSGLDVIGDATARTQARADLPSLFASADPQNDLLP